MSTQQTDLFWENQKTIVENFSWWLEADFYTADMLWQNYKEDNDLPVQTYNQLYDLYTEHLAEKELSDELNVY